MTTRERVEFWPDYAGALLHVAGRPLPLDGLSLQDAVVERATAWVRQYDDSKLPFGDRRDDAWLAEGRAIFELLRMHLATQDIALDDWEGIWTPQTPG
ncbi:MAG TPA: hypothetical protein VK194_07420 [Candidatus Deferrimicrobium sp.]|nr:hypothetical protein [Candidatus Deferrimicrobium sp.]